MEVEDQEGGAVPPGWMTTFAYQPLPPPSKDRNVPDSQRTGHFHPPHTRGGRGGRGGTRYVPWGLSEPTAWAFLCEFVVAVNFKLREFRVLDSIPCRANTS